MHRSLEVDDGLERVVVNLGGAEIGVALGFAPGQFHFGDARARSVFEGELDLVAVKVIALGRREAGYQGLRVPGAYHQFEGLVRLKKFVLFGAAQAGQGSQCRQAAGNRRGSGLGHGMGRASELPQAW